MDKTDKDNNKMILVVGLGNPGQDFSKTRHNLGFMVLNQWVLALGKKWEFKNRFKAKTCLLDKSLLLVKPQTFMNQSGEAVAKLANFYKIETKNIFVIHDELDLPLGKLRLQQGGQTAGHKGLESIRQYLKSLEFIRLRLGIGHNLPEIPAEKYVLQSFTNKEMGQVKLMIKKTIKALEVVFEKGLVQAMNQFN